MNKTVLVTGGAGYIGSHTCKALAAAGYTPVTYDNLSRGYRSVVKWGPLEVGDLLDTESIREVIKQYRPVAALHFAAFAYVGESVQNPAIYYRNNVVGTLNLMDALQAASINHLVLSSTCATYGIPQTSLINEQHPQAPITPYGRSKLMIEQMLADYEEAYGFHYAVLRYFNAAGADPEGQIGELHEPETHLIPLTIEASQGGAPLKIFGADYDTPDGTAVRDYIHVCDLATAHVAALQHLLERDASLVVNLGTGRGYSVREIIAAVEAVAGNPVACEVHPRRAGDPPSLVADVSYALARLGWQPQHSKLKEIVATAWRWHKAKHSR
jgi:UDP-arabinose 4-epimerase